MVSLAPLKSIDILAQYKFFYYLRQGKRSEHWRKLRVWSFCQSICVGVYMMINNSNDVIAPTAQAATPAITFPSFWHKAALLSPSPFLVERCSCSSSSSSNSNVLINSLGEDMHSHERLLVIITIINMTDIRVSTIMSHTNDRISSSTQ